MADGAPEGPLEGDEGIEWVWHGRMSDVGADRAVWESELRRVDAAQLATRELWQANLDGLRALVNERWTQTDKALQTAFATQQAAIAKVAASVEERFHSVDEFRSLLTEQAHAYATRVEMEQHASVNAARIVEISARLDRVEGLQVGVDTQRANTRQNTTTLFTGVGLLVAVVAVVVTIVFTSDKTVKETVTEPPAATTTVTAPASP